MPKLEDVITQQAEALKDDSTFGESASKIFSKLASLGYDTVINQKDKPEFVPITRLNEVLSQKDTLKSNLEEANTQIAKLMELTTTSEETKTSLDKMLSTNASLIAQLDEMQLKNAILLAAKDAKNPEDVFIMIDKQSVKKSTKGDYVGVDAEIDRLKKEKPYLFNDTSSSSGGADHSGDQSKSTLSMNALIRQSAGK